MAQQADTRMQILEAARKLIHEQGYAQTGVAQILREAGVNTGSVYHFFGSKEELLLAVLQHYRELLWPAVMQPAADASDDPVGRLLAVMQGYRAMLLQSQFRLGCPIGNLALEVPNEVPRAIPLLEENFEGWKRAIVGFLEPARARFKPGTDLGRVADYALTVMEGGILLARSRRDIAPFDAAIEMLRNHLETLLEKP